MYFPSPVVRRGGIEHATSVIFVLVLEKQFPPTQRLWMAGRDSLLEIRECARVTGCEALAAPWKGFLVFFGPAEVVKCLFRLRQRSISLSHVHGALQSVPTRGL